MASSWKQQDLPRAEWPRFFDDFSREHVNAPVSIEVRTAQNTRPLADHLPLLGITANAEPGEELIDVSVQDGNAPATHLIHSPSRICVKDDSCIDIESPDGAVHIILHRPGNSTRVAAQDAGMRQNQPMPTNDPGVPAGGKGRRDVTGMTNVYPASGQMPSQDAPIQPMGSWGQGERGPAGYYDSGGSEIIPDERFQRERQQEDKAK
jgi:hypothetical protein